MPAPDEGAARVLEALPEPALLVGAPGRIAFANRAALARLGPGARAGEDLAALCPDAEAGAALRHYLLRCSGSRSALPGAAALRDAAGQTMRFRCEAGLLVPGEEGRTPLLLLRLSEADERFTVLTRKIRELNEEIMERRRAQALLEQALGERDLLLRELHHRVKNNIHMLSGMLSAARREAAAPEAAAALNEASRRLAAVGAVHQMLYQGSDLRGVRGDEFVDRVATLVAEASGARGHLLIEAEPAGIGNDAAIPLALVLNELVANAVKHGTRTDGALGQIRVGLSAAQDGSIELWVEDEGPGFEPTAGAAKRASGLGLVRGLARQLGGTFSVEPGRAGGARCAVRIRGQPALLEKGKA
ncbi:sensor histidine kinase [Belnapia rosea]|uniref:histidine kinase n=1 Tax=Belnapia rosea TaxID=938405 RepID=A0A1G6LX93_9PROT|nr:sensor histidine kinase [Belnapia rosea]SDB45578.1 Two-component sensor histidine kinase, contains HisKA and HATPase domains [Belnapia rosea]SDC47684.1 Two-component sensor histidine kinase, contains HisKA and HATPase domains [Belnapia rosea]